ncbi:hypothetical protein V5N11_033795 [Cardamine amara subsp. amara]|uniref:Uncharacterized protein n=1 Tax=Cardamine amara subsp. amara TaxID=228776 RepID=A0ABD1BCW4_CARAN
MPELTPEEEVVEMNKQLENSEGFDMDFKMFACLFNYRPVDLDRIDYAEKKPTIIRTVLNKPTIEASKEATQACSRQNTNQSCYQQNQFNVLSADHP